MRARPAHRPSPLWSDRCVTMVKVESSDCRTRQRRVRQGARVPTSPALLRLLASWHAARGDVDKALEPLLTHGPVAASRVGARLPELRRLLQEERAAFQRFAQAAEGGPDAVAEPANVSVAQLLALPRQPDGEAGR